MLKNFSNSRKSSPNRTPVKKQTKVQSLLDPARLKPPPSQNCIGNVLSTNTRINYGLGLQQQQKQQQQDDPKPKDQPAKTQNPPRDQQQITLHLDENEILSISPESSVV